MLEAVIWDFGGVFTTSPFEAFARYEPSAACRPTSSAASTPPIICENAWAKFERAEIDLDTFDGCSPRNRRRSAHEVRGEDVLPLLSGEVRPEMVEALRICKSKFKTGCITNNVPANAIGCGHAAARCTRRSDGAVRPRHRSPPRSACASPIRGSTR